jgi:prepilin-type N-terminal cleavage/methylation domain-containing protein
MNGVPMGPSMRCQHTKRRHCPEGFSLLEMMMVITVILIVVSISSPLYMTGIVRAREAVLRDDLLEAVSSQPSAFSEHAES